MMNEDSFSVHLSANKLEEDKWLINTTVSTEPAGVFVVNTEMKNALFELQDLINERPQTIKRIIMHYTPQLIAGFSERVGHTRTFYNGIPTPQDYSNEATYNVGDKAKITENSVTKFYRCTTAVEEPESFDAEKWMEISDPTVAGHTVSEFDIQPLIGNLSARAVDEAGVLSDEFAENIPDPEPESDEAVIEVSYAHKGVAARFLHGKTNRLLYNNLKLLIEDYNRRPKTYYYALTHGIQDFKDWIEEHYEEEE